MTEPASDSVTLRLFARVFGQHRARQTSGFGGIVSVRFTGRVAAARAFAESTRLFALSVSLGGVESLLCYCSEMTHASVRGTELAVPLDLVRLSVGVEDLADLREDLAGALERTRELCKEAVVLSS